jgi:hypothetical protein
LHQPKWRPLLLEDFQKLPHYIREAAAFSQIKEGDGSDATQLNLF